MFWNGNYIGIRELNCLLKEENVTLTQILEADDILQECKADNKGLQHFLTRPEILAELITLITEEPPKDVELMSQYRHATIACEVLTSDLVTLSDRLSSDIVQMNRLCDFVNQEPPLNPLLASFYSKTIEMLLFRSPKQDQYLYSIVCLRVLDQFKARRDFLPGLLRHMCTSAVADVFRYLLRLPDLFIDATMEWLNEHPFLESLIQIMTCSYPSEEPDECDSPSDSPRTSVVIAPTDTTTDTTADKLADTETDKPVDPQSEEERALARERARRRRVAAASNAADLLCDMATFTGDGLRPHVGEKLRLRLCSALGVRTILAGVFTSGRAWRATALDGGCRVVGAVLRAAGAAGECLESAVAPHLPLLHQALLGAAPGVGRARLAVAGLVAQLAPSDQPDVAAALLALRTPGLLLELFLRHPHNNFLHAHFLDFLQGALEASPHRDQFARQLFDDCDLVGKLLDVYEENENNKGSGTPRAGYCGHVSRALLWVRGRGGGAHPRLVANGQMLATLRARMDQPLGGFVPSDNIYESSNDYMLGVMDDPAYQFNLDMEGREEDGDQEEGAEEARHDDMERMFPHDMWDSAEPAEDNVEQLLTQESPWSESGGAAPAEGWAQFEAEAPYDQYWPYAWPSDAPHERSEEQSNRSVEMLASCLLAMTRITDAENTDADTDHQSDTNTDTQIDNKPDASAGDSAIDKDDTIDSSKNDNVMVAVDTCNVADITSDKSSDATPDKSPDKIPDKSSDTVPDKSSDTTPDKLPDTVPVQSSVTASDTSPDTTVDPTPNTSSDTTVDPTSNTSSDTISVTTDDSR